MGVSKNRDNPNQSLDHLSVETNGFAVLVAPFEETHHRKKRRYRRYPSPAWGFIQVRGPNCHGLGMFRENDENYFKKELIKGSLEVKLPTIWTGEKQRWEETEKRSEEE